MWEVLDCDWWRGCVGMGRLEGEGKACWTVDIAGLTEVNEIICRIGIVYMYGIAGLTESELE